MERQELKVEMALSELSRHKQLEQQAAAAASSSGQSYLPGSSMCWCCCQPATAAAAAAAGCCSQVTHLMVFLYGAGSDMVGLLCGQELHLITSIELVLRVLHNSCDDLGQVPGGTLDSLDKHGFANAKCGLATAAGCISATVVAAVAQLANVSATCCIFVVSPSQFVRCSCCI